MAHESFEDAATAELMNRLFVNVKVDREERPDLDAVYMNAVQAMTGQRRLADDRLPDARRPSRSTAARTSRRSRARHARRSGRCSPRVDDVWRSSRDEVTDMARAARVALGAAAEHAAPATARRRASWRGAMPRADGRVRRRSGAGSGRRRSSRRPMASSSCSASTPAPGRRRARDGTRHARRDGARRHARPLGGGFHRYAVDARWLVPHFEKMLYDNAKTMLCCVAMHSSAYTRSMSTINRRRRKIRNVIDDWRVEHHQINTRAVRAPDRRMFLVDRGHRARGHHVFMAWIMLRASAPRHSPTTIRSSHIRRAFSPGWRIV